MIRSFLDIFWLQSPAWRGFIFVICGFAVSFLCGGILLLAELGIRETLGSFGLRVKVEKPESPAAQRARKELQDRVKRGKECV